MKNRYDNCFDFIRLIAAFDVFIGHAYEAFGITMPGIVNDFWWTFRGVPVFFILSGFLNWNSLQNKNYSFKEFAKGRILRLYPELWIVCILNALLMIFFLRDKIAAVPFALFNFTQATIFQFWTPASLRIYGCGTPNGSLWTVGVMVQCYIVLFVLYLLYKTRKKALIVFTILGGGS